MNMMKKEKSNEKRETTTGPDGDTPRLLGSELGSELGSGSGSE